MRSERVGTGGPLRKTDDRQDGVFSYVSLDARVSPKHPLCAIRELFDGALAKLTKQYDAIYAEVGRQWTPEQLFRASMLQALPGSFIGSCSTAC